MGFLIPRQSGSTGSTGGNDDGTGGTSSGTGNTFLDLVQGGFTSQSASKVILSGLVTSMVITLSISVLFCFLRPYNALVYAPRAKHADSKHAPPPAGKGFFSWIPPLIHTKEPELIERIGLDAALFIRFCKMMRNMFLALSVIGCGILIPVNIVLSIQYSGGSNADALSWAMRLTPQSMPPSNAFWAFVVVAYVFDVIICFFLWHNYRAVVRLRRAYFDSPEYQKSLHARTLMVTEIPKDLRSDEALLRIVEDVRGSHDMPRAAIARNAKDLPELVEEHEKTVKQLESVLAKYLKDPAKIPEKRPMCKVAKNDKAYTKGQQVDAIEYLTSRIRDLEIEINEVRESIDQRDALSYGFASYERVSEAHGVAYVARKSGPHGSIVKLAPKPNDLVWKNLGLPKRERFRRNVWNNLWVVVLTIVWVAPNALIAVFLANLQNLGLVWPAFNKSLRANPTTWAIIQGILAPAITTTFYLLLPPIFRRLCVNGGDLTKTSRDRHVMHKLYSFYVFNNLIVFSLFSTLFGYFLTVGHNAHDGFWKAVKEQHPLKDIVTQLCEISPYWLSWLLQRNQGAAVDLSQLITLVQNSFSRRFLSPTPRQLIEMSAPQPFEYAGYYNYFLFYATVAITIGVLQPLLLPVAAFYFWLDGFAKKYMLLYIFITKHESGGMFWRTLFNRCLVFALLGNVVIALLVLAKGGYEWSQWGMLVAMAPLPFLIVGFKFYCVRAFDDQIHFYQTGRAMKDAEFMAEAERRKKSKDRVAVRFGHPALYKKLITPMVSAKAQHLLKDLYTGRTSMEDHSKVAGYSDIYMDPMDAGRPGKATGSSPFEIVNEHQMDFDHFKDRHDFRDELGDDLVSRSGTPGPRRAGTFDTLESDSRSQSRDPHGRSLSQTSEPSRVQEGGVEYPRGYHQTPAMREQSPAGSDYSVRSGHGQQSSIGRNLGSEAKESREGLVGAAARMGRSPPPQMPTPYAPARGGYGLLNRTPGSTPGEDNTSYDYFRRGRNLS